MKSSLARRIALASATVALACGAFAGTAAAQEPYGPEWQPGYGLNGPEWQPMNADQDPNFDPQPDQSGFDPEANQCGSGLLGTGVGCDPSGQGGALDSGPLSGQGELGRLLAGLFGGGQR